MKFRTIKIFAYVQFVQVLARQAEFGMTRELVGYLGGVMIEGGSETTSSWFQSLVLAMAAYPEAQKKAQVRHLACIQLALFNHI